MATSSVIGYPRIGEKREWKKTLENFWKGKITEKELTYEMEQLRLSNLQKQKNIGIDLIPLGDFSMYDQVLDTALMFGLLPKRFQHMDGTSLQTYFDVARGNNEVIASEMTKWFNTNYHYIVPEIEADAEPVVVENRLLNYYNEAKEQLGITGKPVMVGPITFLRLSKGFEGKDYDQLLKKLIPLYIQVIKELENSGVEWVQIDEPILTTEVTEKEMQALSDVYQSIHKARSTIKILLQTYFEAVEHYEEIISLPVDGIGLDFVHDDGVNSASIEIHGFPEDKVLAAGVINGRNIWREDLDCKLKLLEKLQNKVSKERMIIQPSCSLMHVPVTTNTETDLQPAIKNALSFADQKLEEAIVLTEGVNKGRKEVEMKIAKQAEWCGELWNSMSRNNIEVHREVSQWDGLEPKRSPLFNERQKIQKDFFKLPLLPTTTIGSFPQTHEIRQTRSKWRKGELTKHQYDTFIKENIKNWIKHQEDIGLDVFIHGEFERNDMVEYFGEKLDGFTFTKNAWVQSYGSRCVKPPIIYGDVALKKPMTVNEISYAQSLTDKVVKGMLTGPITILNWSFVREDLNKFDVTKQIALALQKEIKQLEKHDIRIIQVDEPALREGLPLKIEKRQQYLDEAVYAFKLATTTVKKETQIHTHMCYSEFGEIMDTIDQLDADVISIETARSHGELIAEFEDFSYNKQIGLGVYDIHSPRVPEVEEMEKHIHRAIQVLDPYLFWVNPDCGLKTRGTKETIAALENMVKAAQQIREKIKRDAVIHNK